MSTKSLLFIFSIFLIACLASGYLFWKGITEKSNYSISIHNVSNKVSERKALKQVLGQSVQSQSPTTKVTKVVDGDTIEVDLQGRLQKLRYIGINTPETVDLRRPVQCFGKQASDENKSLVLGKDVYLEKDVSETDKFGRLLRYVFLKLDDGTILFVNDYLVREGFGEVSTFPPDVKYTDRFLAAQVEAKQESRGLWSQCKK